jgi:hypothetical protein
VPDLVKATFEIQESLAGSGDFTKDYLQNAWERLAPIIKENFPELISGIVQAALKQVSIDVVMSISNKPEQTFKIEELVNTLNISEKEEKEKFNFNTAALEDKSLAIDLLNELIDVFGPAFVNYIESTQKIVLNLLKYKANSKIRTASANSLPLIINSAKSSGQKELTFHLSKLYISELVVAADAEHDNGTLSLMVENVGKIMENANDKFLGTGEIIQLFDKLLDIFSKIGTRRNDLLDKQEKLEKFEEDHAVDKLNESDSVEESDDYAADLDQDIEEIEENLVSIADLIGVIFKTHKELTLPVVEKITKQVLPQFLKKEASTFEEKMALFIIDDLIEHLGQELLYSIWNDLKSTLVNYLSNESPELRQAAAYGLGMFAVSTKKGFELVCKEVLENLDKTINIKSDEDDEFEMGHCRDNAIASLGKVIVHQGNTIQNLEQWINRWIEYLPLRYDDEEGTIHHEMFCNALISKPDLFLGKNYSHLFNLLRINTTIFKSKFSNSKVDELVVKITKELMLNSQIKDLIENGISILSENLQNKFKEIIG